MTNVCASSWGGEEGRVVLAFFHVCGHGRLMRGRARVFPLRRTWFPILRERSRPSTSNWSGDFSFLLLLRRLLVGKKGRSEIRFSSRGMQTASLASDARVRYHILGVMCRNEEASPISRNSRPFVLDCHASCGSWGNERRYLVYLQASVTRRVHLTKYTLFAADARTQLLRTSISNLESMFAPYML